MLYAEFLQNRVGGTELTLAAIDNNQVGQLLALGKQSGVATAHNLSHRGKIVGALNGLDVEVAILLARGFAVAENDTRSNRIGALVVGVVEALDVARLAVKMEFAHHCRHQPICVTLRIFNLHIFESVGAEQTSRTLRKFEQRQLLATLGNRKLHPLE